MNNRTMFERLEERQFLSVTPAVAHVTHPAVHHAHHAKPHHTATKAAAAVNLVGKYDGTATLNFLGDSHSVDVSLNIQSQQGGKLKGTISLNGSDSVDFHVTGTFDAKGNFTVSYDKNGLSASLSGHKTSGGGLTGSMSAGYSGLSADGTFTLTATTTNV